MKKIRTFNKGGNDANKHVLGGSYFLRHVHDFCERCFKKINNALSSWLSITFSSLLIYRQHNCFRRAGHRQL